MNVANQHILLPDSENGVWLKREDLIDAEIPGNKFHKLKYNLQFARENNYDTLLTFGGAFSNHIAAVASAGKRFGFKTIGVIRGEELANKPLNETLSKASESGMRLEFINREDYRLKQSENFLALLESRFGKIYVIPEGGTNELAVKGCEEILQASDSDFDYICCAVGTGGTIAGISRSAASRQKVLGVSSVGGNFLADEVRKWSAKENFEIINDFHFGGYAKIDRTLVEFMSWFEHQNKVSLDPVYTAKMMFGINELFKIGYFAQSDKILAIHTGGLQGNIGMKQKIQSLRSK